MQSSKLFFVLVAHVLGGSGLRLLLAVIASMIEPTGGLIMGLVRMSCYNYIPGLCCGVIVLSFKC